MIYGAWVLGSQIKPRLNGEIYRLKPLWKMATVTIIRYTCISLIYWKIWHTCIRQKQYIDHFWEFVLHLQTWAEPRTYLESRIRPWLNMGNTLHIYVLVHWYMTIYFKTMMKAALSDGLLSLSCTHLQK